jgi:hypothetical protein
MISDRTRTIVIGVVTAVWALNFLAGLVPAVGYQPDQTINGIFMAIVGGLFALGAKDKNGNGRNGGGSGGSPTSGGGGTVDQSGGTREGDGGEPS